MRKINGKLHFKRETIRLLDRSALVEVGGAISQPTQNNCTSSITEFGGFHTCACPTEREMDPNCAMI